MENQPLEEPADISSHPQIALIDTFCELTGLSSKQEALFYLESHVFDLDAAVSTFLDDAAPPPVTALDNQPSPLLQSDEQDTDVLSPSNRSRSPSPPPPGAQSYNLRSAGRPRTGGRRRTGGRGGGSGSGGGGIRTLSDLSRNPREDDGSDSDPDFDPQEYFTGGEKSGMLVQDPTRRNPSRRNDVEAIFDQARRTATTVPPAENSSARNFAGTGRLLSGGTSSTPQQPQQPEVLNHNITFWTNGFTVDDGPLRRLEDPENASFLESVKRGECPEELAPAGRRNAELHVNLTRREEDYKEPEKPRLPFQGAGRTLGSTADEVAEEVTSMELNAAPVTSTIPAPSPTPSLVVDETQPTTSIQLRLADGTRIVSRFNNHHTIRDIRAIIDASRASAPGSYQLQSMGFPPKQLADLDQTIDQAGIANSVVIQKL